MGAGSKLNKQQQQSLSFHSLVKVLIDPPFTTFRTCDLFFFFRGPPHQKRLTIISMWKIKPESRVKSGQSAFDANGNLVTFFYLHFANSNHFLVPQIEYITRKKSAKRGAMVDFVLFFFLLMLM